MTNSADFQHWSKPDLRNSIWVAFEERKPLGWIFHFPKDQGIVVLQVPKRKKKKHEPKCYIAGDGVE